MRWGATSLIKSPPASRTEGWLLREQSVFISQAPMYIEGGGGEAWLKRQGEGLLSSVPGGPGIWMLEGWDVGRMSRVASERLLLPFCSDPLLRLLGCRAVRNQQAEAPEWPRAEGTRAGEREKKKCASCRAGSSLADDAGFVCRGSRWGNKTRQAVAQRQRFRSACLSFATGPTRLGK